MFASPQFLSLIAGDLLVAWAAGRPAPAVKLQADHTYERPEP